MWILSNKNLWNGADDNTRISTSFDGWNEKRFDYLYVEIIDITYMSANQMSVEFIDYNQKENNWPLQTDEVRYEKIRKLVSRGYRYFIIGIDDFDVVWYWGK